MNISEKQAVLPGPGFISTSPDLRRLDITTAAATVDDSNVTDAKRGAIMMSIVFSVPWKVIIDTVMLIDHFRFKISIQSKCSWTITISCI